MMKNKLRQITLTAAVFVAAGLGISTNAQEHRSHVAWPLPTYETAGAAALDGLPTLGEDATLSDYLAYAALNNPGLEAAFNRWKAALERIPQVGSLPDPRFTFGYFVEEVETRVGPQEQKFELSQMFPWFGKLRLRGDVAMEAANAAHEQYQAVKLGLFFEVKDAYYEYYYLGRAIAITEDNIQLLKHMEGVAQANYRAGAAISAVIKAQVELGKLDDRVRTLRDLRGPIVARLNAALSRPFDAELPWPKETPFSSAEVSETELVASLRENNPGLKALDAQVAKEEKSIALAKKDFYPDFMLGAATVRTGEALNTGTPGSGDDPIMAMVALDIPIWRGKYRAGVREARLRREAVLLKRKDRENLLESGFKMAAYRFRDAERKINLFRDTLIPQAEEAMNVTEEGYRAGKADFQGLIDAERLLLEFQLAYERASADREQSLAEIEMLVGRPLGTPSTK